MVEKKYDWQLGCEGVMCLSQQRFNKEETLLC